MEQNADSRWQLEIKYCLVTQLLHRLFDSSDCWQVIAAVLPAACNPTATRPALPWRLLAKERLLIAAVALAAGHQACREDAAGTIPHMLQPVSCSPARRWYGQTTSCSCQRRTSRRR